VEVVSASVVLDVKNSTEVVVSISLVLDSRGVDVINRVEVVPLQTAKEHMRLT
jgi:hypothetical protein